MRHLGEPIGIGGVCRCTYLVANVEQPDETTIRIPHPECTGSHDYRVPILARPLHWQPNAIGVQIPAAGPAWRTLEYNPARDGGSVVFFPSLIPGTPLEFKIPQIARDVPAAAHIGDRYALPNGKVVEVVGESLTTTWSEG